MTPLVAFALGVVVLIVMTVLPGLAWAAMLAPNARGAIATAGVVVTLGLVVVAILSITLAALGILFPPMVVGSLLAATLVPLGWRSTRRQLRRMFSPSRVSMTVAGFGMIVIAVLVLLPSLVANEGWLQPGTTVWYYAHLTEATHLAEAFPSTIAEWGTLRPFQADYAAFTAHSALVFALLPGDLFVRLEAYRIVILLGASLVGAALFTRWMSQRTAVLGSVLLLGTIRLEERFIAFRPETFALVVGLGALYLADRAITERSWRLAVAATLACTATILAHLEVFLVMLPAMAAIALVRGPVRLRSGRRPFDIDLSTRGLAPIATTVVVVSVALVASITANVAISGEPRLLGYVTGAGGSAEDVPTVPTDRIPSGWELSGDPTWDFQVAAAQPALMGSPPPASFEDPRITPRNTLWIWPVLDARTTEGKVLLVGLVVVAGFAFLILPGGGRRLLLVGLFLGIGLFVGSYLIFALADTYVPQRAGGRRILPYELLVATFAAVAIIEALRRSLEHLLDRSWRWQAVGPFWVLMTAVVLVVVWPPAPGLWERNAAITRTGVEALAWIRRETPGARILANAYTDGSVGLLAGAVGIVDGRAAYLEDPEFLGTTLSLVLGARVLFGDPAGATAAAYLDQENVDYVLVTGQRGGARDLGGYRPFAVDLAGFDRSDRYRLLKIFGPDVLRLYRVGGSGETGRAESPYRDDDA